MSNGAKLEEAERIARRGTSLLTFMIIKKRIPTQSVQEALGSLREACTIIETVLPPAPPGGTLRDSTQGEPE